MNSRLYRGAGSVSPSKTLTLPGIGSRPGSESCAKFSRLGRERLCVHPLFPVESHLETTY